MFEGLFQPTHLLVIVGIALLVFGPKKLPELGKGPRRKHSRLQVGNGGQGGAEVRAGVIEAGDSGKLGRELNPVSLLNSHSHADVSRMYSLWRALSSRQSSIRLPERRRRSLCALRPGLDQAVFLFCAVGGARSNDVALRRRYFPMRIRSLSARGLRRCLPSREYPNVFIKDEGLNPTGSFKARGLSACVTMARHFGLKKLAIPSAGNAAGALAAYSAAAGMEAHIFMPKDVPAANRIECDFYGAHVTLVDGLISDCAKRVAELKTSELWHKEGWFDVSTTKEPYRVEGKKTMGYEVAEQLGWRMPQGIIYPTGGGVGLLGMWKAFEEMEALGWIGSERPRMVSVQSAGCAPIVKAWEEGKTSSEMWADAATLASGLRVPKPYGDYLILDILKKSKGTAVSATDDEIRRSHTSLGQSRRHFRCARGRSMPGRVP